MFHRAGQTGYPAVTGDNAGTGVARRDVAAGRIWTGWHPPPPRPRLRQMRTFTEHAEALSVSHRGDEFYDRFTGRRSAWPAEQEAGIGAFYVLVAEDGSVLGRFNLVFAKGGTASGGLTRPTPMPPRSSRG